MRLILISLMVLGAGCAADPAGSTVSRDDMFSPRAVRIHPVFTKISSWTGDERPEGVEALVELRDQFDDTCKGAGTILFELSEFKSNQPDPRGKQIYSWPVEIETAAQQNERWSKTSRCYTFRLAADGIKPAGRYVLSVSFTPAGGSRLFDRVVIGPGR